MRNRRLPKRHVSSIYRCYPTERQAPTVTGNDAVQESPEQGQIQNLMAFISSRFITEAFQDTRNIRWLAISVLCLLDQFPFHAKNNRQMDR